MRATKKPGGSMPRKITQKVHEKTVERMKAADAVAAKAGEIVGRYLRVPFGDGFSYYRITGCCDATESVGVALIEGIANNCVVPHYGRSSVVPLDFAEKNIFEREVDEELAWSDGKFEQKIEKEIWNVVAPLLPNAFNVLVDVETRKGRKGARTVEVEICFTDGPEEQAAVDVVRKALSEAAGLPKITKLKVGRIGLSPWGWECVVGDAMENAIAGSARGRNGSVPVPRIPEAYYILSEILGEKLRALFVRTVDREARLGDYPRFTGDRAPGGYPFRISLIPVGGSFCCIITWEDGPTEDEMSELIGALKAPFDLQDILLNRRETWEMAARGLLEASTMESPRKYPDLEKGKKESGEQPERLH